MIVYELWYHFHLKNYIFKLKYIEKALSLFADRDKTD